MHGNYCLGRTKVGPDWSTWSSSCGEVPWTRYAWKLSIWAARRPAQIGPLGDHLAAWHYPDVVEPPRCSY
jgi:hypothetical protein